MFLCTGFDDIYYSLINLTISYMMALIHYSSPYLQIQSTNYIDKVHLHLGSYILYMYLGRNRIHFLNIEFPIIMNNICQNRTKQANKPRMQFRFSFNYFSIVTKLVILQTRWCYKFDDFKNLMILPFHWCYKSIEASKPVLLQIRCCYISGDATILPKQPKRWCFQSVDTTIRWC